MLPISKMPGTPLKASWNPTPIANKIIGNEKRAIRAAMELVAITITPKDIPRRRIWRVYNRPAEAAANMVAEKLKVDVQ